MINDIKNLQIKPINGLILSLCMSCQGQKLAMDSQIGYDQPSSSKGTHNNSQDTFLDDKIEVCIEQINRIINNMQGIRVYCQNSLHSCRAYLHKEQSKLNEDICHSSLGVDFSSKNNFYKNKHKVSSQYTEARENYQAKRTVEDDIKNKNEESLQKGKHYASAQECVHAINNLLKESHAKHDKMLNSWKKYNEIKHKRSKDIGYQKYAIVSELEKNLVSIQHLQKQTLDKKNHFNCLLGCIGFVDMLCKDPCSRPKPSVSVPSPLFPLSRNDRSNAPTAPPFCLQPYQEKDEPKEIDIVTMIQNIADNMDDKNAQLEQYKGEIKGMLTEDLKRNIPEYEVHKLVYNAKFMAHLCEFYFQLHEFMMCHSAIMSAKQSRYRSEYDYNDPDPTNIENYQRRTDKSNQALAKMLLQCHTTAQSIVECFNLIYKCTINQVDLYNRNPTYQKIETCLDTLKQYMGAQDKQYPIQSLYSNEPAGPAMKKQRVSQVLTSPSKEVYFNNKRLHEVIKILQNNCESVANDFPSFVQEQERYDKQFTQFLQKKIEMYNNFLAFIQTMRLELDTLSQERVSRRLF